MFIQEVVIEGFKSYGQKTVVSGFDPQFNAITGLNGTGKSNILDAICFNLGITNLSQVRAGSLQDLIYKMGQAGITKATVTVTFNNSDPATSPVGYDTHKTLTVSRSIMLGGKTKYTVNGHTKQQSEVQNLFHSVQLNVNNPHFLIMQGRITKVLNMKPPEILSMIEEASGTRMYETKKEAALKTLAKKQTKIDEIDTCMKEDISPALNKLQEERSNYTTWQSNNIEVERLDRFVVACKYREAEEKILSCEGDKKGLKSEIKTLEDIQSQKQVEAEAIQSQINTIENERDANMEGELQQLKKREADISKDLVKYNTLVSNQKDSIASEKDIYQTLTKQLESLHQNISQKEIELIKCNEIVKTKEMESNEAEANAIRSRDMYQNAFAGIATEENTLVLSIPEQVATWEKKAREAQSMLQQGELIVNHTKDSLKELNKVLKTQKISYDSAVKESMTLKSKVDELTQKFNTTTTATTNITTSSASTASSSNPKQTKILTDRSVELKTTIDGLRDQVDKLTASVESKLKFEYSDPERGFDRNRVKGLVAKLVHVTDRRASTALEITAGAKLYQVVVDTEQTGKLLLQKGQLKRRVTILPLNKLSSRCTESSRVHAAKSIASSLGGSAYLALELVGYEEEIRKAMEHTFGNTIICDSQEVAKKVAFDKSVRNRTVTFDGDTFDPSGTLTGGSKNSLGRLLAQIEELSSTSLELEAKETELLSIKKQLLQMEEMETLLRDLKSQLDLAEHSYKICQDKLQSTSYAQTQREIDTLETKLLDCQRQSDEYKQAIRKANDELSQLQSLEKNAKKSREAALKDMETKMKQTSKYANTIKSELTVVRSRRDTVEAELQSFKQDKESLAEQITATELSLRRMNTEFQSLSDKLVQITESYEIAKKELTEKQKELNACSKEIKQLSQQKEKCLKESQEASLEARKLNHKLFQWEKDFKDAEKALKSLVKEHPWIEKEKQYFGITGSDYDFEARDIEESYRRYKQLKSEQDKLSKKINKKVMGMIEKAEAEYEDLRRKKEVIMNDKTKIESVIEELDIKKQQALQTTWVKVTRDFGSIFSMLLPGTQAKLEPPEGCTVNEGLEVKVAFNGIWKDSLTELSGGQRSLLALSLILALLLFKPAPMYILDEVDAALDLSHTQNIGLMLRTHFSKSQFIVVSLKEGMFNNANVIFRTKFVDGVSTVTRTVVGGRSKVAQIENDEENEPVKKKGKDKTKVLASALTSDLGIEA